MTTDQQLPASAAIIGDAARRPALSAWATHVAHAEVVVSIVPESDAGLAPSGAPEVVGVDAARAWFAEQSETGVVAAIEGERFAESLRPDAERAGWRWVALPDANPAAAPVRVAESAGRIDLAALVGRPARRENPEAMERAVGGKRVLITGAGGSIGSEIARLVAAVGADGQGPGPTEITLVDRSENALFEIDRKLRERSPGTPRRAVMHDVVDEARTRRLIAETKPDVIFHAAAHKHVPLMEDHPSHAVTNNYFGTKSIADAAIEAGVGRVVVISSDKAVNPTSVMGATKRLAERYAQGLNRRLSQSGGSTRFSMVRFGNVLGSACSVLPIWSAQLADGGPLTLTDVRMTRYFMTIHEAAALVVQSASIGGTPETTGEIFVLDMGEPVRIADLAERFLASHGLRARFVSGSLGDETLSGLGVGVDSMAADEIEVLVTGARPGEKLHEELELLTERVRPTPLEGIGAWAGSETPADLEAMTADLAGVRDGSSREAVLEVLRRWAPEMRSPVATPAPRGSVRAA
ncbi:MAG: SDR family NAD(P)-dependent oxidoreductase [Planctomycetota bacterium]